MLDMAAMQAQAEGVPRGEVSYARAAYDAFLRLDAGRRSLVRLVTLADGEREIAPGIFSSNAGPGLRVVFMRKAGQTSVLALTGRDIE
jgi:hypothetical protein